MKFISNKFSIEEFLLFIGITVLYYYYFDTNHYISPATGMPGIGPMASNTLPGLYHSSSKQILDLLSQCPLLNSNEILKGNLPDNNKFHYSTFWIRSGDVRTLVPFMTFWSQNLNYIRRWIRVFSNDRDPSEGYESVALDYYPSSSSTDDPRKKYLLILAGLNGGSQEGYIIDLVKKSSLSGWSSFIMIGRGMAGNPINSPNFFNGARYQDLVEASKVVRNSVGNHSTIIVVGISLGGIVVSNALVKGMLGKYVDGVCAISSGINIFRNVNFSHSREYWQPVLAHGLKESFLQSHENYGYISNNIKGNLGDIMSEISDVHDFDSIFFTNMSKFDTVEDYYHAMTISEKTIFEEDHPGIEFLVDSDNEKTKKNRKLKKAQPQLIKPLLMLNAIDDPIIHVDSVLCPYTTKNNKVVHENLPLKVDNFLCLITESGGHVGWPIGLFPWLHKFDFMNNIILEFSLGIHKQNHPENT